jgi:hypothetical protein
MKRADAPYIGGSVTPIRICLSNLMETWLWKIRLVPFQVLSIVFTEK